PSVPEAAADSVLHSRAAWRPDGIVVVVVEFGAAWVVDDAGSDDPAVVDGAMDVGAGVVVDPEVALWLDVPSEHPAVAKARTARSPTIRAVAAAVRVSIFIATDSTGRVSRVYRHVVAILRRFWAQPGL